MSDDDTPPAQGPTASPAEPQELSPGEAKLRAALAAPGVIEAMHRLDAIRREPDPAAPDPIVVMPDVGGEVLVTDTEAAAAYVQPTEPHPGRVPHTTLTRIQVDARVDPRRQPTARIQRSDVLPATATTGDTPGRGERTPSPSSRTPSSRAPSSRPPPPSSSSARAPGSKPGDTSRRGAWWIPLVAACAGAIGLFVVLRPNGSPRDASDDAGTRGTPVAMTSGAGSMGTSVGTSVATSSNPSVAPMASAAPSVDATAMGAAASGTATAPTTTGAAPTAPTAPTTASPKPAPKATVDPYADAGAAPVKTAEPAPAPVPVVTAVPSVGPTAKPAATAPSTNPWDVVFEKKKETGNQ